MHPLLKILDPSPEPSLLARVILDLDWLHGEPLAANLTSGKFPATSSSRDTLLTYCYLGHYPWNAIYIYYMTLCAKDLFFLGHRCLIIKNKTETAVINIVSFLIFIALTQVRVLFDTFLKVSDLSNGHFRSPCFQNVC